MAKINYRIHTDAIRENLVPDKNGLSSMDQPPKVIDFDWDENQLKLILDSRVGIVWEQGLHSMGNYTSVELVIKNFKEYLPKATIRYNKILEEMESTYVREKANQVKLEIDKLEMKKALKAKIRL